MRDGWQSETSIYQFSGARGSGMFDLLGDFSEIANRRIPGGRPDAMRALGERSAQYFDYKPITHSVAGSWGHMRDVAQQILWEGQAALGGVSLIPAPRAELERHFPSQGGKTLERTLDGIDGRTYSVTLYGSTHTDGLVYYALRDTGRTEPNTVARAVEATRGALDSISRSNQNGPQLPVPVIGPGRGLRPF